MSRLTLALIAVALLALPASAGAATVRVDTAPQARYASYGSYSGSEAVFYAAGLGERNRLLVTYSADARVVTVEDPGAVIEAREGCVLENEHKALCTTRPGSSQTYLQHTEADLGDLDDELRTFRSTPFPIGGVAARGGPGDDLLDGGAGPDELNGGGGRDTILGGADSDVVTDGDRTGASGALEPGPDVLDGGPGTDLVAYAGRQAPVAVDLLDLAAAGEPGEGDTVRDVEDVMGGNAGDRLSGDDRGNLILGGLGDDVLTGRGGGDTLRGEGDDDTLDGGSGDDALDGFTGLDAFSCGPGRDSVLDPVGGELLEPHCDSAAFAFGPYGEDSIAFAPYPFFRSSRRVAFRTGCPSYEGDDGEFRACTVAITLREASGARRVLGSGRVSIRRESRVPPAVRVALTPRGRRLASRPGGVPATVTASGRNLPRIGWTITLRAP